jgi:8-oxo-dGTP pyrophosphatase MutT (NUDIX family)
MDNSHIRPVALCVFRKENQILVAEGYDGHKEEVFYRPLGGGMAFGEYSWEAIRREIKEELGEEIKNLTFLGQSENVFSHEGSPGHEIIFMFEGEFVNKAPYRKAEMTAREGKEKAVRVLWKPLAEFQKKRARLYPEGLLEFLAV